MWEVKCLFFTFVFFPCERHITDTSFWLIFYLLILFLWVLSSHTLLVSPQAPEHFNSSEHKKTTKTCWCFSSCSQLFWGLNFPHSCRSSLMGQKCNYFVHIPVSHEFSHTFETLSKIVEFLCYFHVFSSEMYYTRLLQRA